MEQLELTRHIEQTQQFLRIGDRVSLSSTQHDGHPRRARSPNCQALTTSRVPPRIAILVLVFCLFTRTIRIVTIRQRNRLERLLRLLKPLERMGRISFSGFLLLPRRRRNIAVFGVGVPPTSVLGRQFGGRAAPRPPGARRT